MIDKIRSLLEPDVGVSAKLAAIALFIGRKFEIHDEAISKLEARQLEKGEKGDRGEAGPRGEPGVAGRDGAVGATGPQGADGKTGKAGVKGKDGISVVDSEIALDGHLVFKLSDGRMIDAGPLPEAEKQGAVHVSGNAWQITVASTPPDNPQLNQLWLQI